MKNKNSGFIKLVIIIIIALIVLGYYRVDVKNIIESDLVQRNLHYVWDLVSGWGQWIWDKVMALSNNVRT